MEAILGTAYGRKWHKCPVVAALLLIKQNGGRRPAPKRALLWPTAFPLINRIGDAGLTHRATHRGQRYANGVTLASEQSHALVLKTYPWQSAQP